MTGQTDIKRHIRDFETDGQVSLPEAAEETAVEEAAPADPLREEMLGRAHAALAELAETLEAENEAVLALDIAALDGHADAKERLFMRLSELEEKAAGKGIALMDGESEAERSIRAMTARVQTLATENLTMLRDLGNAVGRVASNHAKAVEELNSEGIYSASGRNLRAAELSPAGMHIEL